MPATVRASTENNDTGTTAVSVNKPTGTVATDVVYLYIWCNNIGNVMTADPTGFGSPLIGPIHGLGNNNTAWLYRRVCDGSEASTFSCTLQIADDWSIIAHTVKDADTSSPEDAIASAVAAANGTSAVAPSVSPSTADALLLVAWGSHSRTAASNTLTAPAGITVDQTTPTGGHVTGATVGHKALVAAGATGTFTATINSTTTWAAFTIAVRAAPIIVSPSPVATTLTFPAPTISAGGNASPSPVPMTMAFPVPDLSIGGSVTPSPVAMSMAFPAPTILSGQLITPTPLAMTLLLPAPTVRADQSAFPSPVAMSMAFPAPTILVTIPVFPTPVEMAFGFPPPFIVHTRGPVPVFALGRAPRSGPIDRVPQPPYDRLRHARPVQFRDGEVGGDG